MGPGRMLLSMVEQAADGEVWSMNNANTQCTERRRGRQRTEKDFFMFGFFLSCHET